jgi:hypothetical protein
VQDKLYVASLRGGDIVNQDVFQSLVPKLVDAVPQAIASLKLTKPICCVRVEYYDTHAPCAYLTLRTISADLRAKFLEEKGRDALSHLWASCEQSGDGEVVLPGDDEELTELFEGVYELLCDSEDENMPPYQQMLQRVARELNAKDWNTCCPVTDDFVIAPADGSQYFAGDEDYADIVNSIPSERIALLRSRSLFGPNEDDWERRPGFEYC